jgi:hypothetical protein
MALVGSSINRAEVVASEPGRGSAPPISPPRDAEPDALAIRLGRSAPLAIRLGALAWFIVLRVWVVSGATAPRILGDEAGSWALAQYLTGRDDLMTMHNEPIYRIGTAVLLAPLWAITDDPVLRYRAGLAVLALTSIGAAWAVGEALSRAGVRNGVVRAAAFAVVLLFPATVYTGAFTWAEALVLAFWAMTTLCVVTYSSAPDRLVTILITSLVAGAAPFVHGRMIGIPVVWLGVVVVVSVHQARTPSRRTWSLLGGVVLAVETCAVVLALGSRVQAAAVDAVWATPSETGQGVDLASFDELAFWRAAIVEACGQLWYLGTASAGLALIGLAGLAHQALRATTPALRLAAVTVAAMMSTNFLASTLMMTSYLYGSEFTWGRLDQLVYGRYNDAVAALLSAIGLVVLARFASSFRATAMVAVAAAATAAVGAVVVWRRGDTPLGPVFGPVIAGVSHYPFDGTGLEILRWSFTGGLVALVIGFAAWRSRAWLVCVVLAALAVGSLTASRDARSVHLAWQYNPLYENVPPAPEEGGVAAVASDIVSVPGYQLPFLGQQYALADLGWDFDVVSADSRSLASAPGSRPDLIVLAGGVSPDDTWELVGSYGPAAVWARD